MSFSDSSTIGKIAYEFNNRQQKLFIQKLLAAENAFTRLSSLGFENTVAEIFKAQGYIAKRTKASGDEGKDIILRKQQETIYVECKKYSIDNKVGRPDIQKLAGAMMGDGVTSGFFVTTSSFTKEAIAFADKANIILIDGTRFALLYKQCFEVTDSPIQLMCSQCGSIITLKLPEDTRIKEFKCSCNHQIINEVTFMRRPEPQSESPKRKSAKRHRRKKIRYPT